jgi:hypothetical protein
MYRSSGLVLSAASAFLLLAAPARAQAVPSSTRSGQPAASIPARLIAARAELMLSTEQVRSLQALSDQLAREAAVHRVSSKPWVSAFRLTSPAEAYNRALGALDAGQRPPAATLLSRTGGTA